MDGFAGTCECHPPVLLFLATGRPAHSTALPSPHSAAEPMLATHTII